MTYNIDERVVFHPDLEVMEVDFSGIDFRDSIEVNRFYDRVEELIAETGEEVWFFLVNYSGLRIEPDAWAAFTHRGKMVNLAHSQGTVRFDPSPETRAQIERDAKTEAFDPNLFADRDAALARIRKLPSKRLHHADRTPTHHPSEYARRVDFIAADGIMTVDFSDFTFAHSGDVHAFYDHLESALDRTGRKWFFLINYENCRINPEAWVSFATRGKRLNLAHSLGSVRYAPGSETEESIRMRAESQEFDPNIRNTRAEALERIAEMRRQRA